MALTKKQENFCREYIIDCNATQAAIRAGYSAKTAKAIASENFTKPYINNRIAELMKEKEEAPIAKADEVLRYLTSVLRGQSESEIVVVEGTGDGCSDARRMIKTPDEKERLKAAELLGKRYMLFTDKVETTDKVTVVISGEKELED